MNLKHHINLIQNHGYNGYIAFYRGPKTLTNNTGSIVLVQNEKLPKEQYVGTETLEYLKKHRTIEQPHTENHIQENIAKNGHKGIMTFCTCVGVPINYLEKIEI